MLGSGLGKCSSPYRNEGGRREQLGEMGSLEVGSVIRCAIDSSGQFKAGCEIRRKG